MWVREEGGGGGSSDTLCEKMWREEKRSLNSRKYNIGTQKKVSEPLFFILFLPFVRRKRRRRGGEEEERNAIYIQSPPPSHSNSHAAWDRVRDRQQKPAPGSKE